MFSYMPSGTAFRGGNRPGAGKFARLAVALLVAAFLGRTGTELVRACAMDAAQGQSHACCPKGDSSLVAAPTCCTVAPAPAQPRTEARVAPALLVIPAVHIAHVRTSDAAPPLPASSHPHAPPHLRHVPLLI